ncbi:hypothetical protein KSS87_016444 [Heliosperma pusillum]|nr:hypothetical protein KSS87_016444 [Heliosperma pusillum]
MGGMSITPMAILIGPSPRTSIFSSRMTVKPLAVLTSPGHKMKAQYMLKEGQIRHFHELPSGLKMEVITQKMNKQVELETPPLVFIHGSFHAAWCWAHHWLPFFSHHGFHSHSLSLLAQGESDTPPGKVAGTLETHAADIAHFIKKELTSQPVLIGHSFGGLIVQYYLSSIRKEGNKAKSPRRLKVACRWQGRTEVTRSLAAKAFQTDLPLCKETFFSAHMDDHLVQRYQELMKESSRLPLFDLRKLNASLPVPAVPESSIPVLVVGAKDDFIVDAEGLAETGRFYGVSPVCVEGVAHDMMLDCSWEKGANAILTWLRGLEH